METITIEEQKVNAVKWIKALLSGEYKQTKDQLGNIDRGFCCWGLGCFIVKKEYKSTYGWDSKFFEYIGFNRQDGYINPEYAEKDNLATLNDYTDVGFKGIANYLIKHAETNFYKEVTKHIKETFKDIYIMKEQLVNLETAKLAKEVGFDEPCSHYCVLDFQNFNFDGILHKNRLPDEYNSTNIFQFVKRVKQPHLAGVPTQSLLQKWLREKHGIHIAIVEHVENSIVDWTFVGFDLNHTKGYEINNMTNSDFYNSYEEALEAGLKHALEKIINNGR